jgi:Na+/melibiose symporter-like transporter
MTSVPIADAKPTERVGFGKLLAWSSSHASQAGNVLLLGLFTIYCTDTLGLNPAVVGILLLLAKIIDAVGVLLAGYLVDAAPETKWGKARPFDLAIIGIWVFTALVFAVPAGFGEVGRYIWVFVTYLFVTAVFTPLFTANQPLYMARVFRTRDAYTRISARSGIVIGLVGLLIAIGSPIAAQSAGKSLSGWAILGVAFSVPLLVIGIVRFFTVKESLDIEPSALPRVTFADIRKVLQTNPYLWAVAGIQLFIAVLTNFGALTYYFRYVVGDLSLLGILGLTNIVILPLLLLFPMLVRRFSISRIISVTALLATVGCLIYTFAGSNLLLVVIAGLLTNAGATPIAFLLPVMIIDNATYNEWKGNRRLESVGGGVTAFASQVGAGLAAAIAGIVLSVAGYNGNAQTQTASAQAAIVFLVSWLPAVLSIIVAVLGVFYHRYERRIPEITAEIEIIRSQMASVPSTLGGGTATAPGNPRDAVEAAALLPEKDQA